MLTPTSIGWIRSPERRQSLELSSAQLKPALVCYGPGRYRFHVRRHRPRRKPHNDTSLQPPEFLLLTALLACYHDLRSSEI